MPISISDIQKRLTKLYEQELQRNFDPYLANHSDGTSVRRQIEVFDRYRCFLPETGRILDWGCNHAPDSCIIRAAVGDKYEMHGCDFRDDGLFPTFHVFAGLSYKKLEHIYQLPYQDSYFDVVIGSGVLEHTAMDYESLKEIHRILTANGLFIITFLPNKLSWVEFASRRLGAPSHPRLYREGEVRNTLLHYGFRPLLFRYHQFTPSHKLHLVFARMNFLNIVGERIWPLNQFCTTLMIVARKVRYFSRL